MDTLARAPGGQMRGAATKAMSDIAEERQQSRCPPAAAPLRAAARRAAGRRFPLALLLAPHIRPGYCSSLAPRQRELRDAALGASSKVSIFFLHRPLLRVLFEVSWPTLIQRYFR